MYNNFGLRWYDIVNLFSGEEEDFETEDMNSGRDNISDEIDLQMGALLQEIPRNVLNLFETIPYVKITNDKRYIDGVGTRFKLPFVPDLTEDYKGYYVSTYYADKKCSNLDLEGYGSEMTISSISGSDCEYYMIATDGDLTEDYDMYVKYKIDTDSECFEIKSLKRILRDRVACVLGSRMFVEGESQMRLLDIVCSTKFKPEKNWIPAEFRKLQWWKKPWSSGFVIGDFVRG